jgi:Tol biopolymer transport system component
MPESFTTRTDSPESRSLGLPHAILHSISPKGEMLIGLRQFKDGTLGETLTRAPLAGGAPRPLLEAKRPFWIDWAPDAETFAILSHVTEGSRIEYPRGTSIWRSESFARDLRMAPSGDALAFCEDRGSSELVVVMIDRTGEVLARSGGWNVPTTNEWMPRGCVAWAPGGKEVWFAATRLGSRESGLYALARNGKVRPLLRVPGELALYDIAPDGRVLLTQVNRRVALLARAPGETAERDLSWFETSELADLSLDGLRILLTESGQGGGERLSVYLRDTDGSPAVRLGDGRALALSPDGRWALALSATDPRRLFLLPTGAGEPRELPPAAMDIVDARWRPGTNQLLVSGTEPGKGLRLYTLDIETREARPLARTVPLLFAPSPDGSRVASSDSVRMHIYPIDGGEPQAVPGVGSQDRPLQWTADGRALYVGRFFEDVYRIDEIDLATGRRRLWKDLHLDSTRSPVWNVRVTPGGEAYAYDVRSSLSTLYLVKGLR